MSTPSKKRQMSLIAFMQAQNCSNYVGSWRHPASMSDFMTPEYYQRIARILPRRHRRDDQAGPHRLELFGLDAKQAPFGHRVACVHHQVEHYLL